MILRRSGLSRPAALLAIAAAFSACSAIVDTNIAQCGRDSECSRFSDSMCDLSQRICVKRARKMDGGLDPNEGPAGAHLCSGPDGCFACAPTHDSDFLNACTDANCVPFDNRARLHNLGPDGSLRPLP